MEIEDENPGNNIVDAVCLAAEAAIAAGTAAREAALTAGTAAAAIMKIIDFWRERDASAFATVH